MKEVKTIDDVLEMLDNIIDQCIATHNPVGAFAALYRSVTMEVKRGIIAGRFEDASRMERLDVVFALRFINAWFSFYNNKTTTASWRVAFSATQRKDLYHLQHIFLGMNAHINLDLGIAAAATCPGNELDDLKNDFMEINTLLAEMTEVVQTKLASLSPILGWLDRVAKDRDEQIAGFSLTKARDHAWNVANLLAPVPREDWNSIIDVVDQQISKLGKIIIRPSGSLWRMTFRTVNWLEEKKTVEVIEFLLRE